MLAVLIFAGLRINELCALRDSSMGDPGLEPGTSSLSEKRSNQLS
jgi:hypothetical protein